MTTLDATILHYISIGCYWALNATVVFFTAMMVISGMLHIIWGILEGWDKRVFYPKDEPDTGTTDTEIETPISNLENVEETLNLVAKIETLSQVVNKQGQSESQVVTLKQLKLQAKELKIKGYGRMTKQQLIAVMQEG